MTTDRDHALEQFGPEVAERVHQLLAEIAERTLQGTTSEDRPERVKQAEQRHLLLMQITIADRIEELARRKLLDLIDEARDARCKWAEIGEALDMSPQGVQQRVRRGQPPLDVKAKPTLGKPSS